MKEVNMWTISENKSWDYLATNYDWIKRMRDIPQDARHHAEGNVDIHTQMVIAALISLPEYQALDAQTQEIMWAAALLHDVEKAGTTEILADGSIVSPGHARKGEMTTRQILYKELPAPFAIREQLAKLVRFHGLPLWVFQKPDPVKALIIAALQVDTRLLAMLAKADVLGRICQDQQELLYRIECFEELCKEQQCWGQAPYFANPHARMHYLQKAATDRSYVPFERPKVKVVIMSGLPGAGKDTYVQRNYKDWPVVSLDAIRISMKVAPTDKSGNGRVIQEAKEQARVHLRNQESFVWNATNITHSMREQLISLCLQYTAEIIVIYIEVPYKVLFKQNSAREAIVPAAVMQRLVHKLEVPDLTEAHEVVYAVS
ncbi:AAA family ATPase [Chitinophaga sancti]|uniref:AAA family ATPase n=1 Tax=Chitinophaga sancti TaxID=1004 RepID=A0A1K1LT39_9BACT|nr:AAA family ATPase [Chitinophaga sancti]WQD64867.1 AAA family ATPase [Chitinophaga sancti]WQG89509.1 AAA family ATPase [Chitinophaga sancti]SFW14093.1 Predicted kinase [Chitinophaga sancti]